MKKKEILKVLDIAAVVSIAIATLLMFIFQFTGDLMLVKYSLVMYVASFMMLIVFYSLKVAFAYMPSLKDDADFSADKKQKAMLITKLTLSAITFVIALIILIMF